MLNGNREIFMNSFHDFLSEFWTKIPRKSAGSKSKMVWFNNFWLLFEGAEANKKLGKRGGLSLTCNERKRAGHLHTVDVNNAKSVVS